MLWETPHHLQDAAHIIHLYTLHISRQLVQPSRLSEWIWSAVLRCHLCAMARNRFIFGTSHCAGYRYLNLSVYRQYPIYTYSRVTYICIYPKNLYLSRLTLCPVRFYLLHGNRKYGYSNCLHWNHEKNLLLKIIILFKASILWWTTTIVNVNLSLVLIYR